MKKTITLITRETLKFDVNFYDAWRLTGYPDTIVLARINLLRGEGDGVNIERYIISSRKSISVVIAEVAEYLKGETFCFSREQEAFGVAVASSKRVKKFIRQYDDCDGKFRGFPENARVVFGNGSDFLMPYGFEGYGASVPTSWVEYPNAVYRDGDLGDICVSSGAPVVHHGSTAAKQAYPASFKSVRAFSAKKHCLLFALTYSLRVPKSKQERSVCWGFGPF